MGEGYEAVIGLEVHVQLLTRSKMFCACPSAYGGEPNSRTCPVCLGLPGALPVLNGGAVAMALSLGVAVGATIRERSAFWRKHYFYADLPKGFQITQGPVALVEEGFLEIPGDPSVRAEPAFKARIERIHLEEDAGKSRHDLEEGCSHVDLNRAGVPLLEIVGAPDLRSPLEAADFLKGLHRLVTFLGICDGNLEEGSFRCDANVSLRPKGSSLMGTRVEVKNLNSFRHVRQALAFEIGRQAEVLDAGGVLVQETRGWDAQRGATHVQRAKEEAMDYRTFPEPDLPPLVIEPWEIEAARASLPELPRARQARFVSQYGVGEAEAATLLQDRAFADAFEIVARAAGAPEGPAGRAAAHWMLGEVSRTLNERGLSMGQLPLDLAHLGELVRMVETGAINLATAKEAVLPALLAGEGPPSRIVEARGLGQVSDRDAVEGLVRRVLEGHPEQVAQLRAGKASLRGFLVGQIMKSGGGRINPRIVNELLEAALES